MTDRSDEDGFAEQLNEELGEYEGFSEILSLIQRTAADPSRQGEPQPSTPDPVKPTAEEERVARDAAMGLMAYPQMAELVQRVQDLDAREARNATRAKVGVVVVAAVVAAGVAVCRKQRADAVAPPRRVRR